MNSDFKFLKGNIETIILNALYNGDKYGYEISKEIKEKTDNKYEIKQPTLYGYLKRLEEQDLIEAYWGEESFGGRRKYYRLTDEGKSTCEQFMSEWNFHRDILDSLVAEPTEELPEYTPHENLFLGSKGHRRKRHKKDYKDEEANKQLFDELMKLSASENDETACDSDETFADDASPSIHDDESSAESSSTGIQQQIDFSSEIYPAERQNTDIQQEAASGGLDTAASDSRNAQEPPEPKPELIRITNCDEKFTPTYTSYHFSAADTNTDIIERNPQQQAEIPAAAPVYQQEEPHENEQEKQYKNILTHLLGEQISDTDEKVAHIAPQLANYQSESNTDNLSLAETADAISKEGYRIRFYNTAAAQYKAVPMLVKNKLNCVTAWITLCVFYVLTALSLIIGGSGVDWIIITLFAIGMLVVALFFTYAYLTKPNIRVKPTHDFKRSLINKIIIFIFISLIMIAVDLLIFRIDFSNGAELVHAFLLPELFAAMLPVSELIYRYFSTFKTFYN